MNITRENPIYSLKQKGGTDKLYNVPAIHELNAGVIHGNLAQAQREKAPSEFGNGSRFLIATNVALRGLDIMDATDVINYDLPGEPFIYIHGVRRSARMGK